MNFSCRSYCLFNMFRGTIMPIIRSSRVLYKWLLPLVFLVYLYIVYLSRCCSSPQTGHTTLSSTPHRQLENQAPNTTGSNNLYNTLELLMMGIMVPETCWASNKICNKNSSVSSSWHFISTYRHFVWLSEKNPGYKDRNTPQILPYSSIYSFRILSP